MPAKNKDQIKQYLLERDQKLLPVITSIIFPVFPRSNKDVYNALLHSIVSQQLSVKAAATIHGRLLNLFPNNIARPELLMSMPLVQLRSAGLSKQKAGYLKAIAMTACDGGLEYDKLSKKSDSELIGHLTNFMALGNGRLKCY